MKTLNSLKHFGLALIAMTLMLTAANAQARYKHVPRVKVDKMERAKITGTKKTSTKTTTQYINIEENKAVASDVPATVNATENTEVASSSEEVVVVNKKTKSIVKHNKVVKVKKNKKANTDSFTNKVKENSKLMDIKDVKKSALAKWVIIMIILFAVGLLFLILAFVFLYAGILTYATLFLYYIFLIIGLLCIAGGGVVLTLGLMGVMS
jgi:ABC-type multidrug transport system fused ATPase/permease subunit